MNAATIAEGSKECLRSYGVSVVGDLFTKYKNSVI